MNTKILLTLGTLLTLAVTVIPAYVGVDASTGMGGDPPGQGQDNPQPDRVGNADDEDGDGDDSNDVKDMARVTATNLNRSAQAVSNRKKD